MRPEKIHVWARVRATLDVLVGPYDGGASMKGIAESAERAGVAHLRDVICRSRDITLGSAELAELRGIVGEPARGKVIEPERESVLCYAAHPFGGDLKLLDRAEQIVALLLEHCPGVLAWAPWIPMCRHRADSGESRARGLAIDLAAVRRSDCLVVINAGESPGCKAEIAEANARGIPVVTIFVADDLEPWNTGVKVSWADVGDRILQAARRSP